MTQDERGWPCYNEVKTFTVIRHAISQKNDANISIG